MVMGLLGPIKVGNFWTRRMIFSFISRALLVLDGYFPDAECVTASNRIAVEFRVKAELSNFLLM
jgi:hypothetical protein